VANRGFLDHALFMRDVVLELSAKMFKKTCYWHRGRITQRTDGPTFNSTSHIRQEV
jgi:hypothetical protein